MAFPTHPKLEHIARNARRYNVKGRTIYRWINAGVDIEDPHAVAAYLLTQKNPSQSALNEIRNFLILEAHQTTTTNELHHQAN
jgi:hypothetical protein